MITHSRPPVVTTLGFAAAGFFSFGLVCLVLLFAPEHLSGDPVRGPVLALTHLVTLGWIGSLLFAAAYLVGPLLAESELWSPRLATGHLALHVSGLALLTTGFSLSRYDVASIGAILLVAGLAALIVNLLVTGSRHSRWTPANIAFQSALFWLAVTGVLALLMLRGRLASPWLASPEMLIALHAHFALFGFLAQALLAVSLRLMPKALGREVRTRPLDTSAWTGWIALNTGLMLLVPAVAGGGPGFLVAVGAVIALGVACFAAGLARLLWTSRDRISWGAATHATGVALLVVIAAAALWRLPEVASGTLEQNREWMRLYLSLALLGPFSFAIIGTAERMLPRLVWKLRFGPWAGRGRIPAPDSLAREAAAAPAYFCLLMAWIYFALGQWHENQHAVRVGAILLISGFAWFLVSISAALVRLAIGVTPDDLGLPPLPDERVPPSSSSPRS
ncbi:hypothetical protein ASA1KI_17300 [Opitutales bacterium ASA1]|uniref:hypothetical protein n=1 Tax=Congregicoccus parvus TaxID=3081749 RepID=UPI002B30B740|nr:hypothetical protein ASA1KI_17300 [Opitutales bacterium ASA1]